MKEKLCSVALDYDMATVKWDTMLLRGQYRTLVADALACNRREIKRARIGACSNGHDALGGLPLARVLKKSRVVHNLRSFIPFYPCHSTGTMTTPDEARSLKYKLPDGKVMTVGQSRIMCPEALFRPNLNALEPGGKAYSVGHGQICYGQRSPSVQEAVYGCIRSCDIDIRRFLFPNIICVGGSTMFSGFGERMVKEMQVLEKSSKINVSAPLERGYSTWQGGSILASLATFSSMWIGKDEYDEAGQAIVHRKCRD